MTFLTQKRAIETERSSKLNRKSRRRADSGAKPISTRRVCRFETLENREYLAADPISVGVVYAEQGVEADGDKFYVAWVGGEAGSTTLDQITINLDKNGNGTLDEGETFFDVEAGGRGVYSAVPFTLVEKTDDIGYSYKVEDGGMTLSISFTNFHAGDSFIFKIDVDEYQESTDQENDNAIVEGGEFGGSVVQGIAGSKVSATFTSEHYQTENWAATFVDDYDAEFKRSAALSGAYDSSKLPFDLDDGNEGIWNAGTYDEIDLTPKPIIVSGYVYGDKNLDCNYDKETDDPLANVELTLIAEDGRNWTTTTDAAGYYEFAADDLLPGEYTIVSQTDVKSPEGETYFDFCAKGGEFGTKIDPLHIKIDGMQGGDSAPNNNFAKALVGTLEGYVFEDLNDANNKEPGEEWDGAAYPAKVELYRVDRDANGAVVSKTLMETQTVGKDGSYKFVLDGSYGVDGKLRKLVEKEYEIREVFASEDYSDGTDYVGTLGGVAGNDVFEEVYVGYGESGYAYNFGELKLGSIAGNVYEDRNDNGVIDPGETGIAGVTVELYQWDGAQYVKIDETTTDENGAYLFEDLDIMNDYAIKEVQPLEYDNGKVAAGSLGGKVGDDFVSEIPVGWDDKGVDYNFGELKLGSIEGNVYEDRNNNGVIDPGEEGIENVLVELHQWNGTEYVKIAETFTAADGTYKFDKLDIAKEYAVREAQPDGYTDGKDQVGSLGGVLVNNDEIRQIPVEWDDKGVDYNFGELKLGSISGNVYEDRNNNGVKEEGEAGIGAVLVELFQMQSGGYVKVAETTTDENGFYKFDNLDINETYGVKENQPQDYTDGKDAVGSLGGEIVSNDYMNNIDVQWDDAGVDYNFGELKLGSVSGYVYNDLNDNGIREEGEPGIGGVTVELYQEQNGGYVKIDETTTDENGFYKFDSLDICQTYAVKEIQPTAWDDGKDAVGTLGGRLDENDSIADVEVYWDAQGEEYNYGELTPISSLSGYVYEDDNDNGIKEKGEAGIKGVVVQLYVVDDDKTATLVATQTTDENGYYLFDKLLSNKTYVIRETQPTEYYDGQDAVGTIFGIKTGALGENDEIVDVDLPRGGEGVDYNFGELTPASLSGYVYEDLNDNGIKEANEPGIAGVAATLWVLNASTGQYENTGRTVQTDAAGHYLFDDLQPSRIYRIVETQPSGYKDGKDAAGSLGGTAGNDEIYNISVMPGNVGTDYDFGELTPDEPFIPDAPGRSPSISQTTNIWGAAPTNFPYIWYQPSIPGSSTNLYGGGGLPTAYSWRLSVLNGGYPRSLDALTTSYGFRGELNAGDAALKYVNVAWTPQDGFDYGEWIVRGPNGDVLANYKFGAEDAKPIVGDWTGDGFTKIGVYVAGRWFLDRNGDGVWDEDDLWAELGARDDQPVSGDWDGDGKEDIGIFGPQWASDPTAISVEPGLPADLNRAVSTPRAKNVPPSETLFNRSELNVRAARRRDAGQTRLDLIDHVFEYGAEGDVALTGDWTGDGVTKIGVYRGGDWYFDMNGNGRWDDEDVLVEHMGGPGYQPIVGDFNGDGVDTIGLFANGDWLIDTDGDRRFDSTIRFGQAGDRAVVGDFNGDGVDELAVYRPSAGGSAEPDASDAPRQASAGSDGESVATLQR